MNKKIVYALITAIAVASVATLISSTPSDELSVTDVPVAKTTYTPSDISKAFPDYEVGHNAGLTRTATFEQAKADIKDTVRGTVIDISKPIVWIDPTINPELVEILGERIRIDIQIQVDESNNKVYKSDDVVTISLLGLKHLDGKTITLDDDAEFEIGEQVIVHVAEDKNDIVYDDLHYVKLGKDGKYTVIGDKAFNERNPEGKSIKSALKEAN